MQRDRVLLAEMIEAAEGAIPLVGEQTILQLGQDETRRDAVLWNFTVLSEAAAQVSEEIRLRHPGVAWQNPIRLRNRIVHGYWSIDLEILYTTATELLPDFVASLPSVVASEFPDA
ncbi:MAG TPA: HepT-like ribonuclease domain-containing protein [Acidimicrobiia bacterium]|nr:HepT-like ribonuclease domain-containing protein [Acidimicrobiia bacterium]